jgi:hypothetical protein
MSRNLRVSKASKQSGVSITFFGRDFRSKSVNGAVRSLKMMNKSGIEVAELYEPANLFLRRRQWDVCNDLDFLCGNRNFTCGHSVAQIFHLMKAEEAFLKAQL